MSVFIIAEAGVNHDGDLDRALALVEAASEAGADCVKFQTFRADQLATGAATKACYQIQNTGSAESQVEMLRKLELTPAMHLAVKDRCARLGIEFLSTPFDLGSAQYLWDLGLRRYKIPSGEITNLPLLRSVASFGTPVFLSTGMATMEEVRQAVQILEWAGPARDLITLLHCTTSYPAPPDSVNLRAMVTLAEEFGLGVGYSDHTEGIDVSLAAVALGARVIEKHLTLDRHLPGPDHAASLEPREFADLVSGIRRVEVALGDGIKKPHPSELANRAVVRKSVVASTRIEAGQVFSEENLTTKRPAGGLSPMEWDRIIGRPAPRAFEPDEWIEL